jgi:hypothetical protein
MQEREGPVPGGALAVAPPPREVPARVEGLAGVLVGPAARLRAGAHDPTSAAAVRTPDVQRRVPAIPFG